MLLYDTITPAASAERAKDVHNVPNNNSQILVCELQNQIVWADHLEVKL
jgi:hypothetical protein